MPEQEDVPLRMFDNNEPVIQKKPPRHNIYVKWIVNVQSTFQVQWRFVVLLSDDNINMIYKTPYKEFEWYCIVACISDTHLSNNLHFKMVVLPCNQSYHRIVYSDPGVNERLRPIKSTMFSVGIPVVLNSLPKWTSVAET